MSVSCQRNMRTCKMDLDTCLFLRCRWEVWSLFIFNPIGNVFCLCHCSCGFSDAFVHCCHSSRWFLSSYVEVCLEFFVMPPNKPQQTLLVELDETIQGEDVCKPKQEVDSWMSWNTNKMVTGDSWMKNMGDMSECKLAKEKGGGGQCQSCTPSIIAYQKTTRNLLKSKVLWNTPPLKKT